MKRRYFLATASSGLVGGVAGTSQSAMAVPQSVNNTNTDNILTENKNVQYEADSGRFVYEFEYDIPSNISEITIKINRLNWERASIRQTRGVSREDTTSFLWEGGTTPRLTIESRPDGATLTDGVPGTYASDGVAFEPCLQTTLKWWYSGTSPSQQQTVSYEGEGFAGDGLVFAGPRQTYTRSVAGTKLTIVVPEIVDTSIPHEELLDTFAFAENSITPRLPRDRMTVFIVPSQWGRAGGYAVRNDLVIHDTVAQITDIGSVATHEYVHTGFGVFGGADTYWLKEAIAEYYGYLIALNVGAGTFDAFLEKVTTNRYQDAVLADRGMMQETAADYHKGAHVLAALDAEIQRASNGTATLNDVFTTGESNLSTLSQFKTAVAEASGTSSLSQWLERYVRSESLPEIPSDPQYFVLGDRDSDSLKTKPSTTSDSMGPWQTAIQNDASIKGSKTAFTIRAHKCSNGSVTRPINEAPVSISFDYEIEAEQWWERPYVQLLDDGAPVWTGSVGHPDLYDERVFKISAGGTTRGHVEKTLSGTGPLQLRLGVMPSEACSATDHGNTWFRVTNFEIHSQSLDETDENSSADTDKDSSADIDESSSADIDENSSADTDEGSSADTDESSSTDTDKDSSNSETVDEEIPGFGIVSALSALGGVGYLLEHRRLTDDEDSSE